MTKKPAEDGGGILLFPSLKSPLMPLYWIRSAPALQNPPIASLHQILLSALMDNIYRLIQISYHPSLFTI